MAKQWVCKCGEVNDPDDAAFSSHKCNLCGKDQWLPYYIGLGAAVIFGILTIVIIFMLRYPESAYRAQFSELYRNDLLTPDGQELTTEEQSQLASLKRRFKLDDATVTKWEREESVRAGHDAYRDLFSLLYANQDMADGNPITPAEREQVNQLAKDRGISQILISAIEEKVRRPFPADVLASLYEIYSDGNKSDGEQSRLYELCRKQQITEAQRDQSERDIAQRWRSVRPDFDRGLQLSRNRDYAGAIDAFRKALDADGANPWVLANLSAACLEAGDMEHARESSEKALRIDSRNWLAQYNLASWHAKSGERDEAIRRLDVALGIVSEDQSLHSLKENITARMKNDDSLKSLRQDPRFQQLLARQ